MKSTLFLTLALLSLAAADPSPRDEKVLSLFSVVNFKNAICQPINTGLTDIFGTCYSSTECNEKGGTVAGKCASGFGVCCTFVVDSKNSATVTHNNSVIMNNGWPTALTTASKTITYTIKPMSTDICMMRFNFISFDLGVDTTTTVGKCLDTFVASSPSGQNPPTLCGKNDGQHIYSDVGRSSTSLTATVTTDADTTRSRLWRIQIAQIECSNPNLPRSGCAQWFTACSGRFQSFNFQSGTGLFINSDTVTDYNICFRSNGNCRLTVKEVMITTPDQYFLADTDMTSPAVAMIGSLCTLGRITINGLAHCGSFLNSVDMGEASGSVSTSGPFQIGVFGPAGATNSSTGFNLAYSMSNTFC